MAAGRLRGRAGVAWRYGIASLGRRSADSIVQIVAFGTGIMALLLLGIIRADLDGDWRNSLPADLPNYFFINIPPQSRDAFVAYLQARGARTSRVLPMIRGRLTAIDGRPVETMRFGDHRGEEFANREQNLTWSAALGADNRIVAGRWWTAADDGQPLVSISTEFQQWLGLRLGDRLTFDIAGEAFTARVASIRKVKWDSFRPNFFIVFAPGLLDKVAGTYLTSAYLAPGQRRPLAGLARRFPSVSIFDIDDLLADVRSVLDKAVFAVQSVFAFTLSRGIDGAACGRAVEPRRAALRERDAAHAWGEPPHGAARRAGRICGARRPLRAHRRGRRLGRGLLPHDPRTRPAVRLQSLGLRRRAPRRGTDRGGERLAGHPFRRATAAAGNLAR